MKKIPNTPQAVVVKADGTAQLVPCDASKTLPLDKLHELVGGYVEVVRASRIAPLVMIINEEGKLLNLPLNKNATAWQSAIHGCQQIVGDVVVMCQIGEDLVGLNPKLAKQLSGAFTMRLQNDVISDFLKEHVECELTKVKRHAR